MTNKTERNTLRNRMSRYFSENAEIFAMANAAMTGNTRQAVEAGRIYQEKRNHR